MPVCKFLEQVTEKFSIPTENFVFISQFRPKFLTKFYPTKKDCVFERSLDIILWNTILQNKGFQIIGDVQIAAEKLSALRRLAENIRPALQKHSRYYSIS